MKKKTKTKKKKRNERCQGVNETSVQCLEAETALQSLLSMELCDASVASIFGTENDIRSIYLTYCASRPFIHGKMDVFIHLQIILRDL